MIIIFQVIGVVVADTHENAKHAARKVHIQYEELPTVLSIEEAIASNSFHPETERCLRKGDVDLCFLAGQCDNIIEGAVQVGGQEHFYLEPNSTLVWTIDGGNEVHMISSTQVSLLTRLLLLMHVSHVAFAGAFPAFPLGFFPCASFNCHTLFGRIPAHKMLPKFS